MPSSVAANTSASSSHLTRSLYRKILHSVARLSINPAFVNQLAGENTNWNSQQFEVEKNAQKLIEAVFGGLLPASSVLEYCHIQHEKTRTQLIEASTNNVKKTTIKTTKTDLIQQALGPIEVAKILFRDSVSHQNQSNNNNNLANMTYGFEAARRLKMTEQAVSALLPKYLEEIDALITKIQELQKKYDEDRVRKHLMQLAEKTKPVTASSSSSRSSNPSSNTNESGLKHEQQDDSLSSLLTHDRLDDDDEVNKLMISSALADTEFLRMFLIDTKVPLVDKLEFVSANLTHLVSRMRETAGTDALQEARKASAFALAKKNHKQSTLSSSLSPSSNETNNNNDPEINVDLRKPFEFPNFLCIHDTPACDVFDLPSIFKDTKVTAACSAPLHCVTVQLGSIIKEATNRNGNNDNNDHVQNFSHSTNSGRYIPPSSSPLPFESKLSKHRRDQLEKARKEASEQTMSLFAQLHRKIFSSPSFKKTSSSQQSKSIFTTYQQQLTLGFEPLWLSTTINENEKLPVPPTIVKNILQVCSFQRDGEFDDEEKSMIMIKEDTKSDKEIQKNNNKKSSSSPAAVLDVDGYNYDVHTFSNLVQQHIPTTMLPVDTNIRIPQEAMDPVAVAELRKIFLEERQLHEAKENQVNNKNKKNSKRSTKPFSVKMEKLTKLQRNDEAQFFDGGVVRVSCTALCESRMTEEELAARAKKEMEEAKNNHSQTKTLPKAAETTNKPSVSSQTPSSTGSTNENNNSNSNDPASTPKPLHPFLEKLRAEKLIKQQQSALISPTTNGANPSLSNIDSAIASPSPQTFTIDKMPQNSLFLSSHSQQQQQDIAGESRFRYKVRIENASPDFAIICLSRHWRFIDFSGAGSVVEVSGPGLMSYMPLIGPSAVTSYESITTLKSIEKGGIMLGKIQCVAVPYGAVNEHDNDNGDVNKKSSSAPMTSEGKGKTKKGESQQLQQQKQSRYDYFTHCVKSGFQFDLEVGPIHLNPHQTEYVPLPPSIQDLISQRKRQQQQQKQKKPEQKSSKKKITKSVFETKIPGEMILEGHYPLEFSNTTGKKLASSEFPMEEISRKGLEEKNERLAQLDHDIVNMAIDASDMKFDDELDDDEESTRIISHDIKNKSSKNKNGGSRQQQKTTTSSSLKSKKNQKDIVSEMILDYNSNNIGKKNKNSKIVQDDSLLHSEATHAEIHVETDEHGRIARVHTKFPEGARVSDEDIKHAERIARRIASSGKLNLENILKDVGEETTAPRVERKSKRTIPEQVSPTKKSATMTKNVVKPEGKDTNKQAQAVVIKNKKSVTGSVEQILKNILVNKSVRNDKNVASKKSSSLASFKQKSKMQNQLKSSSPTKGAK